MRMMTHFPRARTLVPCGAMISHPWWIPSVVSRRYGRPVPGMSFSLSGTSYPATGDIYPPRARSSRTMRERLLRSVRKFPSYRSRKRSSFLIGSADPSSDGARSVFARSVSDRIVCVSASSDRSESSLTIRGVRMSPRVVSVSVKTRPSIPTWTVAVSQGLWITDRTINIARSSAHSVLPRIVSVCAQGISRLIFVTFFGVDTTNTLLPSFKSSGRMYLFSTASTRTAQREEM